MLKDACTDECRSTILINFEWIDLARPSHLSWCMISLSQIMRHQTHASRWKGRLCRLRHWKIYWGSWSMLCRFPDGIPFGLVNQSSAKVMLNPAPSTFVNSGDSLLVVRPNGLQNNVYQPSKQPVEVDIGDWDPAIYVRATIDESPMGKDSSYTSARAMTGNLSRPPCHVIILKSVTAYLQVYTSG